MFRIFLAQQRTADQLPVVLALMDRWLTAGELPGGPLRDEVAEVLDRMIVATQLRYPSVGDVARAVRFRYFEKPLVQQARQEVVDQAEAAARRAHRVPGWPADMERVQALVASPEPLIRLLAQRLEPPAERRPGAGGAHPPLLPPAQPGEPAGLPARRAHRRHAATTELNGRRPPDRADGVAETLPPALAAVAALVAETADPSDVVVDLYLSWPDRPADADELAERLRGQLPEIDVLRSVRRVTVTVHPGR